MDLDQIDVPTLVMGARDDTMDPAHMEAMSKRLPKGEYLYLAKGSHLAMYDDQERYFTRDGRFCWGWGRGALARETGAMSVPQIIRTPAGEELVVLPRAEYEALVSLADAAAEDADDVAIYDARMAELAAETGSSV